MTFIAGRSVVSILPEGPTDAKIAIIGEAGGAWEERQRRPFVGPAGSVLEQCLHSAGLTRASVYLTNMLKFRPEKNNIRPWFDGKLLTKIGREAQEELFLELEGIKANVLVPVGNFATYALTGKLGIHKWRGSILTGLNGRKVVPTIHPAACLWAASQKKEPGEGKSMGYIWRYHISTDLKRAAKESESPDIILPERKLITGMDFQETLAFFSEMQTWERYAFDIEVCNYEVSMISFCKDTKRSVCIPFYYGPHKWNEEEEIILWRKIAKLLEDPETNKIGQNTIFDVNFLAAQNNIRVQGRLDDTMTAQHIMYPDFPKGLDFITSIRTREPYYKDEGKMWDTGADSQEFREYNAKDSAVTLEAMNDLDAELDTTGYRNIYEFTLRLYRPLIYMQLRGIRTDADSLATAREEIGEAIGLKEQELNEVCGEVLNAGSPKQCQVYFYGTLGIQPYLNRKTGRVTTDDTAMARLARGTSSRKPLRQAKLVQEVRALNKLNNTYYSIELDSDQRLRCSYNPRGTTTGRLSSSKTVFGTGTNNQNLPPKYTKFLLADEGYIIVKLDKRHAEWVAVANFSQDARMLKILAEGRDPHLATASMMFGLSEQFISHENDLIGHTTDPEEIEDIRQAIPHWRDTKEKAIFIPRTMSMRQSGKKSNHGLNYGEQAGTFALTNEIMEIEAKKVVLSYHGIYPAIQGSWHPSIQHQLKKDRTLTGPAPFNRPRRFLDQWNDDLFRAAYAFLPQSTVSDILNEGLASIYEDRSEHMLPIEIIQQVHDDLKFQYPLDMGIPNLVKAIQTSIKYLDTEVTYGGRKFMIHTDVSIGFTLGDLKEVKDGEHLGSVIETLQKEAA